MLGRTLAKGIFYFVAVTILVWTGSLTYSFISNALPGVHFLVPLLGLVVFDVGTIAWMYVFLSYAEGAIQRSVAIFLCLFDAIGVSLMVIAEILLGGQNIAEVPPMIGDAAIWGIGIWTVVNLLGVIVFHLGDPEARKAMAYQSEKDAIFEGAFADLKQRRIAMSKQLSGEISGRMFGELLSQLAVDRDGNGVPDVFEPGKQTPPKLVDGNPPALHNDGDQPRILASESPVEQGGERPDVIYTGLPTSNEIRGSNGERPTTRPQSGSSGR